ncbi:RNA polymerase sigma factor [Gimesia sp.]|uniref:RNA polymerase sigma factor n=1 Tax=Gimesia sp. TaxID=2024833 RepID=UPI003A954146
MQRIKSVSLILEGRGIATVNRFPQTRQTLIQQIVASRDAPEWKTFLDDYWGPVIRFAVRIGNLKIQDAEDVTAETFKTLLSSDLLSRWLEDRRSRLSTLLCTVVRNIISNRARVQSGREKIMDEITPALAAEMTSRQSDSVEDHFYEAWAEELLHITLQQLQQDCFSQGRVDAFRVFYGKSLEGLSNVEIARYLDLKVTDVENYYKRTRGQLVDRLRFAIEEHVRRYGYRDNFSEEVELEWQTLGEFLKSHGDLESIFRQLSEESDELRLRKRHSKADLLQQLTSVVKRKTPQHD